LRVTEGGLRSSVHRSIWEQAFRVVDSRDRSLVKIAVDGVGARIAEGLGAVALYIWVRRVAPGGIITHPLDTRWMAWLTLATVLVWLMVTRRFRQQSENDQPRLSPVLRPDIECERFPDQCPCTTELGKGVA
jgi:hypothetical protein